MAISAIVIGVGTALVGTATSVYGAMKSADAAEQIAADQKKQSDLQHQQAELEYKRNTLQAVRNAQIAGAMSLARGVAQNAQGGTGVPGGLAQISGYEHTNLLGLAQNEQLGTSMWQLNADISQQRMYQAQYGAIQALGSGLTSLGSSMVNGASAFGRLTTPSIPAINLGAPGGGYYGTNGALYPGPGYYP